MGKENGMTDVDAPPREKTIIWDEERTKFMLDWYIEYKKNQHAGFVFKKPHHMKCADAVNKEFGTDVTVAQVDRHYRDYKERWGIVAKAFSKSGNVFDSVKCKLTVSESEKGQLSDRARRLFAKPIKFYYEMEELFLGRSADGSLAADQETCLDDGNNLDSSDSGWVNDTSCYAQPVDPTGDDSDTLPTPKVYQKSPRCVASSSSTPQAGKKRSRGKSPSRKPPKSRSRSADGTEEISTIMKAVVQALAELPPRPPPLAPHPGGAHATLWKRIEALPISTDDKISIGVYLAHPEKEGMRDFLSGSSDNTLEAWANKFRCGNDGRQ